MRSSSRITKTLGMLLNTHLYARLRLVESFKLLEMNLRWLQLGLQEEYWQNDYAIELHRCDNEESYSSGSTHR
jgi:hypothetical protein